MHEPTRARPRRVGDLDPDTREEGSVRCHEVQGRVGPDTASRGVEGEGVQEERRENAQDGHGVRLAHDIAKCLDAFGPWVGLLGEEGYESVGDLMVQMNMDPDIILAINGIGPKAMEEIEAGLAAIEFEVVVGEEPEVVEEVAEIAAEVEAEVLAEAAEIAEVAETAEAEAEEEPAAEVEVEAAEEMVAEIVGEETPVAEAVIEEVEVGSAEVEDLSLEEMFRLQSEELGLTTDITELDEDEQEEIGDQKGKKKKKKKRKKYVEMEYDPDHDVMIVKRKKKRGGTDWDESWEEDW